MTTLLDEAKSIHGTRPRTNKASNDEELELVLAWVRGDIQSKQLRDVIGANESSFALNVTGIPTPDLYALQSKCDDAERRGFPWSAIFWKEIKPQENSVPTAATVKAAATKQYD